MQAVLRKTQVAYDQDLASLADALGPPPDMDADADKRMHVRRTKAAEVRAVRNVGDLREPEEGLFKAREVVVGEGDVEER